MTRAAVIADGGSSRAVSSGVMRAAVLRAPGMIETRRVNLAEPGPAEVRVRLEGCGVCASNLPPWEGREWFKYPMAPGQLGHEGWAGIDAVGAGASKFAVGQRVGFLSNNAYAEYDVARQDQVIALPEELNGQPFPAEPLGCAINIFRRSEIRAGQTVAIVGVGFLGALLIQLAKSAKARVIAISRRSFSLDVARECGADEMIAIDDHAQIIERVGRLTDGRLCDVVIEAVGKQGALDLSAELTRERGRLVIAGYHQDGLRQCNVQLWNWRGIDVINAHERDPQIYLRGMREAAEAVAGGHLDPRPLYTHTFSLDRLGEALEMTKQRPDGFLKGLILMKEGAGA
ncbi:MAG: threonine dehydrogenase [Phycisphaerales bacterium]|nr:threonine dehydrogenase [Phycisphaerales bacterium]